MITNASFKSPTLNTTPRNLPLATPKDELPTRPTSIYLFPSFKYVTLPVTTDAGSYESSLDTLIQEYVHTGSLETGPVQEEKDIILQQLKHHQANRVDLKAQPVNEVVVLICGHGGRDRRCGALGLPLQKEFEEKLQHASINVLPKERSLKEAPVSRAAHVGLISHIGGHKWAGNVVIYIPPSWHAEGGHALSGSAIWYGRVEPRHVEGIVQETVLGGRLIEELWRGGMRLSKAKDGGALWRPIATESP